MAFIGPSSIFNKNKIYALEQFDNKLALANTDKFTLIENVCKHRQAIMVKDQQDYFGTVTCPLHGWTYDKGALIGEPAGFFKEKKCLTTQDVFEYNGLLFSEDPGIDFASIPMQSTWDFQNYVYSNTTVLDLPYKWEYFIEAVLDSYHINYMHPGLSNFCDLSTYKQQSGKGWTFQTTDMHKVFKKNPSKIYTEWQNHITKNYPNRWTLASLWLVMFPNVMLEAYPGTCLVSSVWPNSENGCKFILHHFYEEDIVAFDKEFIELEQARYMESAAEDDDFSIRIHQGRSNVSECYTHPLESQIDEFYKQNEFMKFVNF